MEIQAPSLNMMVYDLLNIVSGGRTTRDNTISTDQVKFWVSAKREVLILRDMDKNKILDTSLVQDLGCIEVIPVSSTECCDIDLDCVFLRSKLPIPMAIGNYTRFGPITKTSRPWTIIQYDRVPLEKYAPKYSQNGVKGYFKDLNNYLYIYYNPNGYPEGKYITHVNLQGILKDPTLASSFDSCSSGTACYTDNESYPMTLKMWEIIKTDILQKELRLAEATEVDDSNNGKSDKDTNGIRKTQIQNQGEA